MLRFIPLVFLALPMLEIALFILVGRAIGVLPTLGLVMAGIVIGSLILRRQGLGVLNRMRSNMQANTLPGQVLFDGMVIAIAAVLLIIPGFFSDILALLLLLPPLRQLLYKNLTRHVSVVETTTSYRRASDPEAPPLNGPGVIDLDDDDWQRK